MTALMLIFLLYLIFTVIIFVTYRIKNDLLRWFFILSPPLSLITLIWIPSDIFTVIFWGPAMITAIYSGFSFFIKAFLKAMNSYKQPLRIVLIRPILTILIFTVASYIVELSIKSADTYAVETAKRIKQSCKNNLKCPDIIQGWNKSDAEWLNCTTLYGKYGTQYPIRYRISEDGTEFTISVRHNIDEGFHVTGGISKDLEAKYSICSSEFAVDINTLMPLPNPTPSVKIQ